MSGVEPQAVQQSSLSSNMSGFLSAEITWTKILYGVLIAVMIILILVVFCQPRTCSPNCKCGCRQLEGFSVGGWWIGVKNRFKELKTKVGGWKDKLTGKGKSKVSGVKDDNAEPDISMFMPKTTFGKNLKLLRFEYWKELKGPGGPHNHPCGTDVNRIPARRRSPQKTTTPAQKNTPKTSARSAGPSYSSLPSFDKFFKLLQILRRRRFSEPEQKIDKPTPRGGNSRILNNNILHKLRSVVLGVQRVFLSHPSLPVFFFKMFLAIHQLKTPGFLIVHHFDGEFSKGTAHLVGDLVMGTAAQRPVEKFAVGFKFRIPLLNTFGISDKIPDLLGSGIDQDRLVDVHGGFTPCLIFRQY